MGISRENQMLEYVEDYYKDSRLYKAQNTAKGKELDIIHTIVEDLPNQFNPQTATWSLKLWEDFLGIESGAGNVIDRRIRVIMKLLTLQRITPVSMERLIKNVAKANIDIVRNVAPYTFKVRVREDSLDCDNELIRQIIENYKEAHMAFYQAFYLGQIVIREHFYVKTVHRMSIYWFGIDGILNGRFLLDGSRLLNTKLPPYDMKVRNRLKNYLSGEILLQRIISTFLFALKEFFRVAARQKFIFNWWANVDSSDCNVKAINRMQVFNQERFTAPAVTTIHNLWRLDGTVPLDGRQTLDAYQIKEVLK